jgi:triosephosphate isomerase
MRRGLVVGNWKMNGNSAANVSLLEELLAQVGAFDAADLAVCPPFPYLLQAIEALQGSRIGVGAQNLAQESEGAFTGEVSAAMLKDIGCQYVIVGHSERRAMYGETNEVVAQKFVRAQSEGLTPILCVGETLQQREAGKTLDVVTEQLQSVVSAAGIAAFLQSALAYEPVWAIGTGKTATPEQAQAVHAHLREVLAGSDAGVAQKVQILYGGSVKGDNAAELFAMADIDGALVGGASLVARDFAVIGKAADC